MSATQSVTSIPRKIEESLSAIRNPAEATAATLHAALIKLNDYEVVLGMRATSSRTSFAARLEAVKQAAEKEVTAALPKPLSEVETAALSLEAIRQGQKDAHKALEKLTQLSAIANDEALSTLPVTTPATPAATPAGTYVELPDNREGFAPQRAYLFSVEPSNGTVLEELTALLGKQAAKQLAADWGDRCNLDQKLEATQVALFLDSNNKAQNRDHADEGDKTTQEEDFTATKYQFAGDLAATLLCARIFKKAQDGGPLSDGEQDLCQKLKEGYLRSCSGALVINDLGHLRANSFFWASRVVEQLSFGLAALPGIKII